MRRSYSSSGGSTPSVTPPYEENCMFYAPLNYGDLSDHISGAVGYPYLYGDTPLNNLEWNSTEQAYRLQQTSYTNGANPIVWDVNVKNRWAPATHSAWTLIFTIKRVGTCVYQLICGYGYSGSSYSVYGNNGFTHMNSYQSYISTNSFDTVVITNSGNAQPKVYINGTLRTTINYNAIYNPQNWNDAYFEKFAFGTSLAGNYGFDGYVKKILVYNRLLSTSEIDEVNAWDGSGSFVSPPEIFGTTPFETTSSVSMTAAVGASIYYTTNGSTPTTSSTLYTSAFSVNQTTTIKAIAVKDGIESSVATKEFVRQITAPVISGDTPFSTSTTVTITAGSGYSIYYTINGNNPTTSSTLYTAPFLLTDSTTVKAIAYSGGVTSNVSSMQFVKSGEMPDFSFIENLMFYAPMRHGDLKDYVSGTIGSSYNDADSENLVWSSSMNAYKIKASSNGQNPIRWNVNMKTRWGNATEWSAVFDEVKISSMIYAFVLGYCVSNDSLYNYGYSLSHLNSYQSQISSSTFKNFAMVYSNAQVKLYVNGSYVATVHSNVAKHNPSNWLNSYFQYLSFGSSIGGNYTTWGYVKNLYLCNKALSTSEIQEIITYNNSNN